MKVLVEKALDGGEPLWPERYPAELLEERRRAMGSVIFSLQYQNDARLAQGAVFREEWLSCYTHAPADLAVYQGVDLAISCGMLADYFAIVTVGVGPGFNVYVLDTFRARLSFERQLQAVVARSAEFDPLRIAVEATAYQAAFSQMLISRTPLPVKQVFPHRDKVTRALRLSALFENGKVFLRKGQEALKSELLAFPDGEHDDLFDALEMAVSLARAGFKARLLRIPGL